MSSIFRLPLLRTLALSLSALLVTNAAAHPLPPQNEDGPKLNLVIVEGDGAINNIRQRVARETIVQVEDENRKPVAGATVSFFLPNQGPSGTFLNGGRSLTVMTDANGRAVAQFRPNNVAGEFQVRVSAAHQGQVVSTSVAQSNILGAAAAAGAAGAGTGISMKLLAIVAIAGAAAAGGAVAATRGGGNGGGAPAPAPTVVTPGTPSVGAPR
ncbi:MAG: hypothetical protein ACK5AZ_03030 [Bryobacteraceae bacterium]